MKFTAEEVDRFDRDGFLLVSGALGPAEVDALRAEADRILNEALNVQAATLGGGGRLRANWRGDLLVVRIVQPVNDVSPPFAALAEDARVAGAVGQLMRDQPTFAHEKMSTSRRCRARPS